jgi:hypothetical protein
LLVKGERGLKRNIWLSLERQESVKEVSQGTSTGEACGDIKIPYLPVVIAKALVPYALGMLEIERAIGAVV